MNRNRRTKQSLVRLHYEREKGKFKGALRGFVDGLEKHVTDYLLYRGQEPTLVNPRARVSRKKA